ncbi:Ribosomal-protein-S18p-alanine acetyltransferase [hydrothermal vent metagenome]|uniref:Ribosomal-protein-S18p-alanine acetyltransferase n=1 Tax=hydrothermal vent metagenome TaxID=652676 RepID=A0A3B0ZEZ2_9ZZZZ
MNAILDSNLISFREMTEQDLALVLEIEQSVYEFPWSVNIFKDCMRVGYYCQVMEDEQCVVGYSALSIAAGESHLLNICVHKAKQGKGLGHKLLAHSIETAKRLNASIIFLEVRETNQVAIQIYHSTGFNQIGTRQNYYPAKKGKEDALIFALQL